MRRPVQVSLLLLLSLVATTAAEAQEWRPSTRQMPEMPAVADLAGDWLSSRATWFAGVESLSGVSPGQLRAVGEARRGSRQTQVVRFTNGPIPVVVWQDRNGDGRADMVEIYRGGGIVAQVIDADYDGQANVVRRYDSGGALLGEERL